MAADDATAAALWSPPPMPAAPALVSVQDSRRLRIAAGFVLLAAGVIGVVPPIVGRNGKDGLEISAHTILKLRAFGARRARGRTRAAPARPASFCVSLSPLCAHTLGARPGPGYAPPGAGGGGGAQTYATRPVPPAPPRTRARRHRRFGSGSKQVATHASRGAPRARPRACSGWHHPRARHRAHGVGRLRQLQQPQPAAEARRRQHARRAQPGRRVHHRRRPVHVPRRAPHVRGPRLQERAHARARVGRTPSTSCPPRVATPPWQTA